MYLTSFFQYWQQTTIKMQKYFSSILLASKTVFPLHFFLFFLFLIFTRAYRHTQIEEAHPCTCWKHYEMKSVMQCLQPGCKNEKQNGLISTHFSCMKVCWVLAWLMVVSLGWWNDQHTAVKACLWNSTEVVSIMWFAKFSWFVFYLKNRSRFLFIIFKKYQ